MGTDFAFTTLLCNVIGIDINLLKPFTDYSIQMQLCVFQQMCTKFDDLPSFQKFSRNIFLKFDFQKISKMCET